MEQLGRISPSFKKANSEFSRLSKDVEKIEGSILGKISTIDDTQLKSISRRIFDPAETNPKTIFQAKKAISKVDSGAWDDILRVELERRLGIVKGDIDNVASGIGASVENLPGQLERAIFGNNKQRKILFTAASEEQKQMLGYLKTVLDRASLGRPGQSIKDTSQESIKNLKSGVISAIRNFITAPIKTVAGAGEESAFNRKVRKIADVLFDPKYTGSRRRLIKLNAESPAAARAMAQMLNTEKD